MIRMLRIRYSTLERPVSSVAEGCAIIRALLEYDTTLGYPPPDVCAVEMRFPGGMWFDVTHVQELAA